MIDLPFVPDQLPFEFDLDEDEPRERYAGQCRYVISVSQLKMFSPSAKGCPRKWAMHYLAGFARAQTPALKDGIRLHRCVKDRWHGIPGIEWDQKWQPGTKTVDLALAMMRHVPDRHEWVSEPTFFLEVPELDTAIYIKPDLLSADFEGIPYLAPEGFKDWKSTAAAHKRSPWVLQDRLWWPGGKLPEPENGDTYFSLENDIQGRVYGHGLMTIFGGSEINAEWIYGSKKFEPPQNPATWALDWTYRAGETKDWCKTYVWPTIRAMNAIRQAWEANALDSVLLVPHNAFSCQHKGHFCEDLLGHCNLWKSPISLDQLHLPVIPA